MFTRTQPRMTVRWCSTRDHPAIVAIDAASGDRGVPWTLDTLAAMLSHRNTIGMLAERDARVVGYMVYALCPKHMHLLDLVVAPDRLREGIGTVMVGRIKDELPQCGRDAIRIDVRETSLGAQLFLRAQGFKATGVVRELFKDTGEDGFRMRWEDRR